MFCTKCGSQLDAQGNCPKCSDATEVLNRDKKESPNNADATIVLNQEKKEASNSDATEVLNRPAATPQPANQAPVNPAPANPAPTNSAPAYNTTTNTTPIAPAPMKKKKKKSKKGLVIFLIILFMVLAILIAGGVLILLHMFKPINRFSEEMKQGNVEAAMEYFDKIDMTNEEEAAEAKELALDCAEQLKTDFYNETTDYATTIKMLDKLEADILAGDADYAEIRAYVDKINASRAAYTAASKMQEAGKLEEAIIEYAKVDEEDSYYDLAQTAITDCEKQFLDNILAQVKVYQDEKNYKEAIELIDKALLTLENDATLVAERKVCLSDYEATVVDEALAEAKEMVENTDDINAYKSACEFLDGYLVDFPENNDLSSLREKYATAYCDAQIQNAKDLVKALEADEAIKILEEVQTLCPDNEEVADLLEEYKEYLPTSLYDITIYEQEGESHIAEHVSAKDTFENEYEDATRVKIDSWGGAGRKYLVNSKYNHFHCILSYELSTLTSGEGKVVIYADDEQIYDSGTIKDTSKPITVDVDFGEAQFITIKFYRERGEGNILMSEAEFSNVPK